MHLKKEIYLFIFHILLKLAILRIIESVKNYKVNPNSLNPMLLAPLGQSKKNSVSGGPAGCLKEGVTGDFFFIFAKMNNIFPQ